MNMSDTLPPTDKEVRQEVFQKIGQLTRQLHDTLIELGYAEQLQGTASRLPDAKSRLAYIARLTGDAAENVLNHVDQAKNQYELVQQETSIWLERLQKSPASADPQAVLKYVQLVNTNGEAINQHLTDIMMAQNFHDLTGQVIAKVVNLATTIEDQLLQLLLQAAPNSLIQDTPPRPLPELSGPVVEPEKHPNEVVTNQSQVDDLLASLGF